MRRTQLRTCCLLLLSIIVSQVDAGEQPKIVSVKKIWDQGTHNAFRRGKVSGTGTLLLENLVFQHKIAGVGLEIPLMPQG